MDLKGNLNVEYASLTGKIRTFVVDKTLSVSGACADAKATGEEIKKMDAWKVKNTADTAFAAATSAVEMARAAAKTVTFDNNGVGINVTDTWTKSGSYYKQDVTVDGILADDNPIVDIVAGATDTDTDILSYAIYFGRVFRITTSENKITLYSTEQTPAFKIQLKVVR